jgi:hypothetical protein
MSPIADATTRRTATQRLPFGPVAGALAAAAIILGFAGARATDEPVDASPIFGVTLPEGFRQWPLIAPAVEAAPLDALRAVLGNATAIAAYEAGTLPFPDGTVLVKLAWKWGPSAEFPSAHVPAATTVQVMVKDHRRYATTGGWGFGRFVGGEAVDRAQHETCFACHEARVRGAISSSRDTPSEPDAPVRLNATLKPCDGARPPLAIRQHAPASRGGRRPHRRDGRQTEVFYLAADRQRRRSPYELRSQRAGWPAAHLVERRRVLDDGEGVALHAVDQHAQRVAGADGTFGLEDTQVAAQLLQGGHLVVHLDLDAVLRGLQPRVEGGRRG